MRILLVAYDYPPLSSPQAIRWFYLSRELVRLGADVHVLAPDLPSIDANGLSVPTGVTMHRCDAGGLAGWLARRRKTHASTPSRGAAAGGGDGAGTVSLNWKGRLHQRLERLIGRWVYPDVRGQWRAPAGTALSGLLSTIRPDVLISSHEPAVTLQLGLRVASTVPAWMVDLGDPVLATYTPKHWRKRAAALEAKVCQTANAISVTTVGTRDLLMARHNLDGSRIFVLSQGYDDTLQPTMPAASRDPAETLHLLYTGRFYSFRDPTALLEAVLAVRGVRLTIVAPEVKPDYLAFAARSDGRIVFLGEQSHAKVLELQRDCDVLVNIGNALEAQIPGKLFEYLGTGKPILHCESSPRDPASALVTQWHCGWVCQNDQPSLQTLLSRLPSDSRAMVKAVARDSDAIARHGWSRLGACLFEQCAHLVVDKERVDMDR